MKLQAIILAAGKGTRMNSAIPKPLIKVNGTPMLTSVLETLDKSVVAAEPVIVVGSWTNAIQEHYGDRYCYAVQQEINGTGGAVEVALPYIDTTQEAAPVLILYADTPFISTDSLHRLRNHVLHSAAVITMYTVTLSDFNDWREGFKAFGRVLRNDHNQVDKIVEFKAALEKERLILEVNPAVYCVNAAWLKLALPRINPNPITSERYLTDIVALARADNLVIDTTPLPAKESFGFNSFADVESAKKVM